MLIFNVILPSQLGYVKHNTLSVISWPSGKKKACFYDTENVIFLPLILPDEFQFSPLSPNGFQEMETARQMPHTRFGEATVSDLKALENRGLGLYSCREA